MKNMTKKKHKKAEINLNLTIDVNLYIDQGLDNEVKEAIKHFSKRFRKFEKDDEDTFYLYHKEQLDKFLELNTNPLVKINTIYDDVDNTKIFCYELFR